MTNEMYNLAARVPSHRAEPVQVWTHEDKTYTVLERRQLWADAAASGEYKQTTRAYLAKDISGQVCHCYTGLGLQIAFDFGSKKCEFYAPDPTWDKTQCSYYEEHPDAINSTIIMIPSSEGSVIQTMWEFYGLTKANYSELIDLNDRTRMSFEELNEIMLSYELNPP